MYIIQNKLVFQLRTHTFTYYVAKKIE